MSVQLVSRKYENVLQQMDSGIVLFDRDGELCFMNIQMEGMLGAPQHLFLGCTLSQLIRHPYMGRDKRKMIVRIYKETITRCSKYCECNDSQGRTWLVTVTYGDQLDGDVLLSFKDISESKRIELTAVQNDKLAMLGQIAAAIAHEIRNPLTSIRGFIQLLRPHLQTLGKDEYARIILSEIDRANDIIYEFLNSSKPTDPMKRDISVSSLVKEVILLSESEALMKGCQIDFAEHAVPLYVSIDVKQIKQVILNVIKNAVDAISSIRREHDGLIRISVARKGGFAHIMIRDNGKGMDKLTMSRLFDPFFTTKQAGTGLGMSVSARIVKNHGGTIEVQSEVGEGTEFTIVLPLAAH